MHFHLRDLLARAQSAPGQVLVGAGLVGAVTVAPVVFSPWLYDNFTLPKQSILLVSAALICIGLAMEGRFLPSGRWLRIGLCGWLASLTLSWMTGIDPWGGLLGYYQYRQGYLTQIAYAICFLGARSLDRRHAPGWLSAAGLVGLSGALCYTTIQALGLDPVDWWSDTSERTIGTIGNANELAAYALVAFALAGSLVRLGPGRAPSALLAISAAVSFIILETESRSGIAAFLLALVLFPLGGLLARLPRKAIARHLAALAAGSALGLVLGLVAGSVPGTAGRVVDGMSDSDAGGSTRVALWRGAIPAITASPVLGSGPDGLHLAFAQHRPANLGGVFKDYDLVAQSSHNSVLDAAANTGLVGLASLALLVGSVVAGAIRKAAAERDAGAVISLSAITAYGLLTLLNPISMAAHALFFVLLGVLGSERELAAVPHGRRWRPATRLALAACVALPMAAVAVALPRADIRAQSAWSAYARGDFGEAAQHYHDAARAFPFERHYAGREAAAWLAAGVGGGRGALTVAEQRYLGFDERFGLGSDEALGLAAARIGLGRPAAEVFPVIDLAVDLNPHGLNMPSYAATLRDAAVEGGVLRYWEEERSVYVAVSRPTVAP